MINSQYGTVLSISELHPHLLSVRLDDGTEVSDVDYLCEDEYQVGERCWIWNCGEDPLRLLAVKE